MSANNKKANKSSSKKANKQRHSASQPRATLETSYDVEFVFDKQVKESRIMYKIGWYGYPLPKDQTWEPIENIRTVVAYILDFEQKNTDLQVKTAKINLKLVAQYRENTIEKEQMTQVLGFDTVNQAIFVLWTNAMVTTLHVKELDSTFIHAIACLINRNFEKRFNANKSAFDQKVETLKESEKERDPNEVLPNQDDIRRLSNVIESVLRQNGWPVLSVEGDSSRIMVNPVVAQERTEHGYEIIQCTLCETCGERFERPNVAFFQHLHQSGHNGSYLKDVIL